MLNITHRAIWTAEGDDFSGFHPRCCVIPQGDGQPLLLMTVQEISGSDHFHAVQYSTSSDGGATWSARQTVDAFIWRDFRDNIIRGVCDTVPHYHGQSDSILAVAHDVYYLDGKLLDTIGHWNKDNIGYKTRIQRRAVYVTSPASSIRFSEMQLVEIPEIPDCSLCTSGTSDKVLKPDGRVIIPLHYAVRGRADHLVFTAEYDFDGARLKLLRQGNHLELPVGRGLLEPQVTEFAGRYYLSLRAEDQHGHVSTSTDGLHWQPIQRWTFDSGADMTTDTTQQHWLTLGGRLYLLYTRREPGLNDNVTRWRSPLWIAEVDPERLCLLKDTEQIVLPLSGDGVNDGDNVPMMGNFQPAAIDDTKAIVTVGACNKETFKSDTLLAEISV